MELIDSHAHIDAEQFAEDREAMLERARAAMEHVGARHTVGRVVLRIGS